VDCFAVLIVLLVLGVAIYLASELRRLRAEVQRLQDQTHHLAGRLAGVERAAARPEVPASSEPAAVPETVAEPLAPVSQDAGAPPPPLAVPVASGAGDHAAPVAEPAPAPSGEPVAPAPQRSPPALVETLREEASATPPFSLEAFVGGRLLLVVGVVVVLFGLAFFLKYAIDKDWIGPGMRIAMGVAVGIAALVGGDRIRARGLHVFGTAVMGGGLGALYLSIFFAATKYGFVARPTGMALMALVTAAGVSLALARGAPFLAYLGFLGGFLAPALLSTGTDALGPLTLWLLFLLAGVLVVTWRRPWHGLDLMSLVACVVYYAGWSQRFLEPDRETMAALSLGALTLGLVLLCLVPPLVARKRVSASALGTLALLAVASVLAGHDLLFDERRYLLAGAVAALSAIHLAAGWDLSRRDDAAKTDSTVISAIGLALLATAIPIFFDGRPVTPVWSAVGAAAVFVGARRRLGVFALGGVVMIALAFLSLLGDDLHTGAFTPFLNVDFLVWLSPCIALVVAGRFLATVEEWPQVQGALLMTAGVWVVAPLLAAECLTYFHEAHPSRSREVLEYGPVIATGAVCAYSVGVAWIGRERESVARVVLPFGPLALAVLLGLWMLVYSHRHPFFPVFNAVFFGGLAVIAALSTAGGMLGGGVRRAFFYAAVLHGLVLLTGELLAHGDYRALDGFTRDHARQVAQIWISVTWAVYAAALVSAGFWRRRPELRWAGLAVFLLTVAKVFLFDMAALDAIYRIGSFLVLGVLAIAASFLYQRARESTVED